MGDSLHRSRSIPHRNPTIGSMRPRATRSRAPRVDVRLDCGGKPARTRRRPYVRRDTGSIRLAVTTPSKPLDVAPPLPLRARLAVHAGRTVAAASRIVRLGSGSVIGGRASLAVDRDLLAHLSEGRDIALVSATNGKTTTTRLLSAALSTDRRVVSNRLGANMTPGIVAALGRADRRDTTAVIEVDERWLPRVLDATSARTVLLLNLSRDQLDRTQEVRDLAIQWRRALETHPGTTVIANSDDPLVAWAAMAATDVVWVAAGAGWTGDATGCPACGGSIDIDIHGDDTDWHCTDCSLRRPAAAVSVDDADILVDGHRIPTELSLPGRINRVNAAFALAAANAMGADAECAASGFSAVREVAGRYRVARYGGVDVRLLLAKNPAGWNEALELLESSNAPMVASINARIADGHDPSWLWDVGFERLKDRFVVVTGERRADLAVRLRYAEVDHIVCDGLASALEIVRASPHHDTARPVDVASNYTAFQDHLALVGGVS